MDVNDFPSRPTALQQHGLGAEHGHRLAVFLQVQLAFARHPGEIAADVSAAAQELLMLCSRAPVSETPVDREGLRVRLVNQKMEKMADQYLARLKADAIIRTP